MIKRQAIFLDRDGVLNHAVIRNGKPFPPATIEELCIFDDAQITMKRLKKAGFLLIGITNQPDVARQVTSKALVERINAKILETLPLDDIRVCYHDDIDHCECRKPLPGLLLQAAKKHNIDLNNSIMIGDRWKDIEAGINAGCKTIWIKNHYTEPAPPRTPDFITASLTRAANWILKEV